MPSTSTNTKLLLFIMIYECNETCRYDILIHLSFKILHAEMYPVLGILWQWNCLLLLTNRLAGPFNWRTTCHHFRKYFLNLKIVLRRRLKPFKQNSITQTKWLRTSSNKVKMNTYTVRVGCACQGDVSVLSPPPAVRRAGPCGGWEGGDVWEWWAGVSRLSAVLLEILLA